MGKKFIPNGDMDFAAMAHSFARVVAADPARVRVDPRDADVLSAAVEAYRAALNLCRSPGSARAPAATRAKEDARAEAERHVRRIAHVIRAAEGVDGAVKVMLKLRERAARPKQQTVPDEPPRLRFIRALHEGNGAMPMHELAFYEFHSQAKVRPAGAVRVELFVDLIPPDEPIPAHPGANHGGRPWYLRSYTRNPIVLAPPMARVPMRVVYWARWADSSGDVGPFSATAAAWIEGGSHQMLPGGVGVGGFGALGAKRQPPMIEDATATGPAGRERKFFVAVVEAQYDSMNPRRVAAPSAALPEPREREPRQIEGPAVEEAA